MHSLIVQTEELRFRYRQTPVLDGVGLAVPTGSIYGFLGPNGAGKTTTIKLLLGLLSPTSGIIRLFGKPFHGRDRRRLARIGNLIEAPSAYRHLTARENLRILDTLYRMGESRIDQTLELVGLTHAADRRAGRFSQGMKQRLGVAMALFHDPDLLILDEPLNGLDPEGIQELRGTLSRLRDSGKSIVVSSHLLGEVEKVCSHIGVLSRGRLVWQGELAALEGHAGQRISLRTSDGAAAAGLLQSAGLHPLASDRQVVVEIEDDRQFSQVLRRLIEAGVDVYDVRRERRTLEEFFVNLMDSKGDAA